ncbi:MAG: helix-turn-helix domain-containing protein [Cyanobacteriota bacterium]
MSKYHLPAEEVRRIRRSLGETQAEFAQRLCVDAVTVARWETDQRKCTGLYAKTIAELAQKNSLLIKERGEMEGKQELIRSIELHEIFNLGNELKPIRKFFYEEVPLEYRKNTLEAYSKFLKKWQNHDFFEETCHSDLFSAITSFLIIVIPEAPEKDNFITSIYSTKYQDEKLSKSYRFIYKTAKKIASNSIDAESEFLETGHIGDMFLDIQSALDDLLKQPSLKEGDIAIVKFFRSLVQFALKEKNAGKFLPIPRNVSFAFARFLSVLFAHPIKILVPELDDSSQLESLRNS